MFLTKKTAVKKVHFDVSKQYFLFLATNRTMMQRLDNDLKIGMMLVDYDIDACMELYRCGVCEALELDYTSTYCELASLSVELGNFLKAKFIDWGMPNYTLEERQAFLEACVHCMVYTRNNARGDYNER